MWTGGCLLALALAGCGGQQQPRASEDGFTLSAEVAQACRGAADDDAVIACIDGIAAEIDARGRQGAFNGLLTAASRCWSPARVEPLLADLYRALSQPLDHAGHAVEHESREDDFIYLRSRRDGDSTYNVRVKLISARTYVRDCVFSAVQWSAFRLVERDGGSVIYSDGLAPRLAKTILEHIDRF